MKNKPVTGYLVVEVCYYEGIEGDPISVHRYKKDAVKAALDLDTDYMFGRVYKLPSMAIIDLKRKESEEYIYASVEVTAATTAAIAGTIGIQ